MSKILRVPWLLWESLVCSRRLRCGLSVCTFGISWLLVSDVPCANIKSLADPSEMILCHPSRFTYSVLCFT
jgi:hypothetical protein